MRRKGVFRACRESFVPVGPDGSACWESFVPVEASWRGARDRCESTVGTKGSAARAAGRMDASVSVALGITGRCPAISQAIHCEHHAGLCQFGTLCHLCCGIACEIGGGARYWGGRWRAGRAPVLRMRVCTGKEDEDVHWQRERACTGPENEGVSRSSI